MQTVKHKMFGIGEVISREDKASTTHIIVRFKNGKEMGFSIPESFMFGIIAAEGSLKEEVDAAIAQKKAGEQERVAEIIARSAISHTPSTTVRHGRVPTSPVAAKGSMESAFEEYLINAGYKKETDSGNPSTVFAYTNAIKTVLEEEGISWYSLQNDIENVIALYDVGGPKEYIGAKSNRTVINALKRYGELVNG